MKILVIGSNGQLGWELCRRSGNYGFDITPLDIPEFDITDPGAVNKAVKQTDTSLVVNASAYTAVDKAESEPELAFAINRDGPAFLRPCGLPDQDRGRSVAGTPRVYS